MLLRGVADVNVLISALVSPLGVCGQLWDATGKGWWRVVASPGLVEELEGVLAREKFRQWVSEAHVRRYVSDVWDVAEVVPDAPEPWPLVTRDPKDDYLVALARVAGVDALISGDVHLTELVDLVQPVMLPVDFLAMVTAGR